jgi:hypothetical protein
MEAHTVKAHPLFKNSTPQPLFKLRILPHAYPSQQAADAPSYQIILPKTYAYKEQEFWPNVYTVSDDICLVFSKRNTHLRILRLSGNQRTKYSKFSPHYLR